MIVVLVLIAVLLLLYYFGAFPVALSKLILKSTKKAAHIKHHQPKATKLPAKTFEDEDGINPYF